MLAALLDQLAEVYRVAQAFFEERPGGLAVRHEVVVLLEELEDRARRHPRVLWPDRERRDHLAERLEHADHERDRRSRQGRELRVGLLVWAK